VEQVQRRMQLLPLYGDIAAAEIGITRSSYIASKWPFPLRYEITSKSKLMKSKLAGNESTNSNFV
jgi:hypothetical protein